MQILQDAKLSRYSKIKNMQYLCAKLKPVGIAKKKGGTRYYYPYNNNPLIFTNQSNRQQGGFGDLRHSLLPSVLVDTARDIGYSMSSSNAEFNGNYPGVNPNWRFQPLK